MEKIDRKYIFACNSAYDYNRYWAMRFNDDGSYTFTDVGAKDNLKDKKIFKNTLAEIDAKTCCTTEKKFCSREISKGSLYTSKVGRVTIFYKEGSFVREIRPVFDNPLLMEKLSLVRGNSIYDKKEVDSFVRLIKSADLAFVKFIGHEKEMHNTGLSGPTVRLIQELSYYVNMPGNYTSNEVSAEIRSLEESLRARLTSYKEYRELFIVKHKFFGQDSKGEEVQTTGWGNEPSQQLTFFPQTEEEKGYSKLKKR